MSKVVVIPCSGMGKVYGLLAREAAYKVVNELKKDEAETKCLAYIVTGDDEIRDYMNGKKCITIDGCPKMCAAKNAKEAGAEVVEELKSTEFAKQMRAMKPGTATYLNEEGWQVVDAIAEKITTIIDEMEGK